MEYQYSTELPPNCQYTLGQKVYAPPYGECIFVGWCYLGDKPVLKVDVKPRTIIVEIKV
jgi:hypothetical protein